MAFKTNPKKSANLPMVRGSDKDYRALAKQAMKAGITPSEAIRQLLAAYLVNPFKLSSQDLTDGLKDRHWAPLRAQAALVAGITKAAQKAGVSVGEAIRQIVRNHLAQPLKAGPGV